MQGVGFRPFVYRLAHEHGVCGSVQNRVGKVEVVAVASPAALDAFQADLIQRAPPLSRPMIQSTDAVDDLAGSSAATGFEIISSSTDTDAQVFVPPDYFMCDDCRQELDDDADRRYQYPFINCTQCGPRYTLIESLPYDRPNTSMSGFPLCPDCEKEYLDPADRRFHAEPVACERCGPSLRFEADGQPGVADNHASLEAAVAVLREGGVAAIKGIGGYHLVCDACRAEVVEKLRHRKHRPDKPLAVMFPLEGQDGLAAARRFVEFRDADAELVASPIRPIVLATKKSDCEAR